MGWFVRLTNPGEKVLAPPVVMNSHVLATTYLPVSPEPAHCPATVVGHGRVYVMSLLDGSPVKDLNGSGALDLADRNRLLAVPGIPPMPVVIFSKESQDPLVLVGSETPLKDVNLNLDADWKTVYWYE